MAIYRLVSTSEDFATMEHKYRTGQISYKDSKEILTEAILEFFQPIRTLRQELEQNPEYVADILAKGAKEANLIADQNIQQIRKLIGLN